MTEPSSPGLDEFGDRSMNRVPSSVVDLGEDVEKHSNIIIKHRLHDDTSEHEDIELNDMNVNNETPVNDDEYEQQPTTQPIRTGRWADIKIYLWKIWEIITSMIPLGLLSFGGPAAHIAILQENFVTKRNWVTTERFTELFALSQSLPGPASTKLVIALGTLHAGYFGGFLSFILFSAPTAIIMASAGLFFKDTNITGEFPEFVKLALNGFSCAAVAIVAHAAYLLSGRLAQGKLYKTLLIGAFAIFVIFQKWWIVLIVMFSAGLISVLIESFSIFYEKTCKEFGLNKPNGAFESIRFWKSFIALSYKRLKRYWHDRRNRNRRIVTEFDNIETPTASPTSSTPQLLEYEDDVESSQTKELPPPTPVVETMPSQPALPLTMKPVMGFIFFGLFLMILATLTILRYTLPEVGPVRWAESFFRIGSLIFGGGHVVIPMILNEFSELGYLNEDQFLNGFALQSALPGPMFNISAYVGSVMGGFLGGLICWICLFLPGFLFVWAALPLWNKYREKRLVQSTLRGVNAAAVGFVFTAVYVLWLASVPNFSIASAGTVVFSVLFLSVCEIPAPFVILAAGLIRNLLDLVVPRA